jgi:hypothetical protein
MTDAAFMKFDLVIANISRKLDVEEQGSILHGF